MNGGEDQVSTLISTTAGYQSKVALILSLLAYSFSFRRLRESVHHCPAVQRMQVLFLAAHPFASNIANLLVALSCSSFTRLLPLRMSMPVDSHPLSPEEITPMPRNVRQRTSRAVDPGTSRPVTSYFTLKSQSDERAAASILNWNPNNSAPNVENVTVKPSTRRPPSNPFLVLPSGSSSPEQVNGGYASKIAMAANVNGKELTNGEVTSPAMTPRAQTLVLSTEEAGITDDISSKISTTKWHAMNDDAMDEKIVQLAQRSQGAESSRQAYRSVLRILSSQLDALKATHTTCEKERANEQLKRRKVASLMRTLPPESVATVRAVLEILVETDVKETPVEGPQLVSWLFLFVFVLIMSRLLLIP